MPLEARSQSTFSCQTSFFLRVVVKVIGALIHLQIFNLVKFLTQGERGESLFAEPPHQRKLINYK